MHKQRRMSQRYEFADVFNIQVKSMRRLLKLLITPLSSLDLNRLCQAPLPHPISSASRNARDQESPTSCDKWLECPHNLSDLSFMYFRLASWTSQNSESRRKFENLDLKTRLVLLEKLYNLLLKGQRSLTRILPNGSKISKWQDISDLLMISWYYQIIIFLLCQRPASEELDWHGSFVLPAEAQSAPQVVPSDPWSLKGEIFSKSLHTFSRGTTRNLAKFHLMSPPNLVKFWMNYHELTARSSSLVDSTCKLLQDMHWILSKAQLSLPTLEEAVQRSLRKPDGSRCASDHEESKMNMENCWLTLFWQFLTPVNQSISSVSNSGDFKPSGGQACLIVPIHVDLGEKREGVGALVLSKGLAAAVRNRSFFDMNRCLKYLIVLNT